MSVEEKRKLYRCKENYVTIDKIQIWPEFYNDYKSNKKNEKRNRIDLETVKPRKPNSDLNSKIGVFLGDITTLEIDAIVNAANNTLLGGGGVDGAIHRSASNLLLEECKTLGGCNTGEAKITAGYKLPAKYVIHTVGPRGYNRDALESAYRNCLNVAIENQCRTIAFPCISTGIYGYPNKEAASEITALIRDFLEENMDKFDRIIFCLFMDKDIDLYFNYLSVNFPMPILPFTTKSKTETKEQKKELEEKPSDEKIETSVNISKDNQEDVKDLLNDIVCRVENLALDK